MKKSVASIFIVCFPIFCFFSCNSFFSLKEVGIENEYNLMVPDFMEPTSMLNENASLQYQNTSKEVYLVVLHNTKGEIGNFFASRGMWKDNDENDLFDKFCHFILNNDGSDFLESSDEDNLQFKEINGRKVKFLENTRTINGIDIFYNVAFIEGEKSFYQIMIWTLKKYKEKYENVMAEMLLSFEEV
ncbi:MAG: hypothetical protein LUG18_00725 [Candidatus Azobacteroides sp.]|nr:hypothetical protein [Candidatus Azobacteroides sp.]